MNYNLIKYELQNTLSGKSGSSDDPVIQAVASHLRSSQRAGPMAEEKHKNKAQEAKRLEQFAREHSLFINEIDEVNFISSGAEQRVYLAGAKHVLKVNDAIYYASWEDYFHSLLLNNYFFADTSYKLLGFYKNEEALYAVVQQHYVEADAPTKLEDIKSFLSYSGFQNTRNNDYFHPKLGIILEDLHDENVLSRKGLLYFIDTVFYVEPSIFWS